MTMPHRAPFVHHTNKLLPYGTAKESSICKKMLFRRKKKLLFEIWQNEKPGAYLHHFWVEWFKKH